AESNLRCVHHRGDAFHRRFPISETAQVSDDRGKEWTLELFRRLGPSDECPNDMATLRKGPHGRLADQAGRPDHEDGFLRHRHAQRSGGLKRCIRSEWKWVRLPIVGAFGPRFATQVTRLQAIRVRLLDGSFSRPICTPGRFWAVEWMISPSPM